MESTFLWNNSISRAPTFKNLQVRRPSALNSRSASFVYKSEWWNLKMHSHLKKFLFETIRNILELRQRLDRLTHYPKGMDKIIAYQSALQYWRAQTSQFSGGLIDLHDTNTRTKQCLSSLEKPQFDFPDYLTRDVSLPFHVIVGNSKARVRSKKITSHTWQKIPKSSTRHISDGTLISTPEFCFLQMASTLTLAQLILLGYEICGTYAVQSNEPARCRNFSLTTGDSLTKFTKQSLHLHGYQKASRAVPYIIEGSASPMESILTMLLCLPYKLGGYNIATPVLNCRINIPNHAKKLTDKNYYVCDLCWPKQRLCIEYDSTFYHNTHNRIESDARRRNTLLALNYTVLTVSANQVMNPELFGKLARQVSKILKSRLSLPEPQFSKAHTVLRKELCSFAFNKGLEEHG